MYGTSLTNGMFFFSTFRFDRFEIMAETKLILEWKKFKIKCYCKRENLSREFGQIFIHDLQSLELEKLKADGRNVQRQSSGLLSFVRQAILEIGLRTSIAF